MTNIRILLVDDVAQVRQDLRTVLTLTGEIDIVGEAANGLEAVRLVESMQPDAVLMDLEMPVMDGYEAAKRIKASHPSCRVVGLTVHDYDAARIKACDAGMDDFLVKGTPVQNIVRKVATSRSEKIEGAGDPSPSA